MNMIELFDLPGIVITHDKVTKTSKIKKFVEKNKLDNYNVIYVKNPAENFKDLNRQLQELENDYLGIAPPKEKPKQEATSYRYTHRINVNTILCAHNIEDLNKLKQWLNLN